MRRVVRALATATVLAAGESGCGARGARVVGVDHHTDVAAFLEAHPLGAEQAIRVDALGRTEGSSQHVVQVRTAETPHRHETHDLIVSIVRGGGRMVVGPQAVRVLAGDAIVVPRGVVHWFANTEREPAVALVTFVPPLDAPDVVPVDSGEVRR